ncbi:MAG: glycosyltransferase family 4 protein [Chloroflexota bacterium]|jgi:glycosyltransferase involved in cell wall biosynthesis
MNDGRRGLALFFTLGVSLVDWQEAGYLHRELSYYRRLAEHVGPVTLVTYGGEEDARLGEQLEGFRVLNNPERLPPEEFMQRAPDLYRRELEGLAIFKSNQIKGAHAVIHAAGLTGGCAIVRGGYLLSRFVSNRPVSTRMRFGLWRRELALFHQAGRVFLPTSEDAQYAQRWYALPAGKVVVVPNFVDTDLFRPREDLACEPGLVCFVGRLAPQKNLAALIEAMAGLKGARLRLIGDGPQRNNLFRLAQEKGVPIEILGTVPQEELPVLLAECEAFVLPSLYEGLPKSLLEAMAAGVPVVATQVQGSASVIQHRETGWLCEDTSPEALHRGLSALLRESRLRAKIGRAARQYMIESFSLEGVLAREVAVYKELGLA